MLCQSLLSKVSQSWGLSLLLGLGLFGCTSTDQTDRSITTTPKIQTTNSSTTTKSSTSNLAAFGGVRPLVVATNTVVCHLTEQIAGSTIDLKCLMAPSADPHKYQPQPGDSKAIETAKLILYRGGKFEPGLSQLLKITSNPAPKVAVDEVAVPNPQQLASSKITDPLVFQNVKIAEVINKSLAQLEPNSASLYAANTQKITNELTELNSWSKSELATIPTAQRQLIIRHELEAYLNPSPWPNLNEQARLARVPVIMYHDILPKKQVFFDVTLKEFEQHLRLLHKHGVIPISLDQLVTHLRTGLPLPAKPILLTFDDGYGGHYEYAYPLLKQYGYPAVFSIYTMNVGKNTGRTHVTWEQLRQMAADPLVTIASHSVTHPLDLRSLSENQLKIEVMVSKRILEAQLGIPIRYFTYPSGKYDARVTNLIREAGYEAALTMSDSETRFAGQSKNLLTIDRIGQSKLQYAIAQAWGGTKLARWNSRFELQASGQ